MKDIESIFETLEKVLVSKDLAKIEIQEDRKILKFKTPFNNFKPTIISLYKNYNSKEQTRILITGDIFTTMFPKICNKNVHQYDKTDIVYCGLISYRIESELRNNLFYVNYIKIRIKNIPTYFGVNLYIEKIDKISVNVYIGYEEDHESEIIENDDLLLELAKDFIFENNLQIIDYLQDKDYEIGKLF